MLNIVVHMVMAFFLHYREARADGMVVLPFV